jgi:N-acetylglucosaminyldiphosphoundecaprenol N-acetyl-beta-D-mannosaminyltransferase
MSTSPATTVILGIPFHAVTFPETVAWARQRILSRQPGYIATANMDFVMQAWRDPELHRILLEAELVVADGNPLVWLSRFLGPKLPARVTGSDLVPMLAEMCRDNQFALFHLGGAPGVPEKAAEVLTRRYPGLRIAGCYSPPKANLAQMNHREILARLEAAQPDLLYVAFGAPKQEKWVQLHIRQWQVPLTIGIGGSLDFLAGTQRRAPRLVQRLGLEWLWRMCSDPPRLMRRYLQNIAFFAKALTQLLVLRYRPDHARPPVAADAPLRQQAHVAPVPHLPDHARAEAFCEAVVMQATGRPVILDLSGRPWLSSLEQGTLLRLTMRLRRQQQPCILLNAGSRVRKLLIWTHLADFFQLDDTSRWRSEPHSH